MKRRTQAAPTVSTALAVAAVLAVTGAVALHHAHRAIWTDEAWVVHYAAQPTVADALGQAIANAQPASPGYLAGMHLLTPHAQGRPWLMRLPTALCFAAMLLMMGAGLWKVHGRREESEASGLPLAWVPVAVALPAMMLFDPRVQQYVTEIKQYTPAAMLVLLQILLTVRLAEQSSMKWRIAWLLVALASVTVTFFGLFSVAACSVLLIGVFAIRKQWPELRAMLASCFAVALVFIAVHLGFNQHIAGDAKLAEHWEGRYLSLDASAPFRIWHLFPGMLVGGQTWYPNLPWGLLPVVAAAGWMVMFRRLPIAAMCISLIVALVSIASAAGKWPLGFRINLPLLMLAWWCVFAAGLEAMRPVVWLAARWRGWVAIVPRLATVALVLIAGVFAWESGRLSHERARVRELIDATADHVQTGDVVVTDIAGWVCQSLSPRPSIQRILPGPLPTSPKLVDEYEQQFIAARDAATVYLAVGHHNPDVERDLQPLIERLASRGQVSKAWSDYHVALYRFDRSAVSTAAAESR